VKIIDVETNQPSSYRPAWIALCKGAQRDAGLFGATGEDRRGFKRRLVQTGDIAVLDEDGFIRITDRLSRFSKIGGEMVPHIRVEDKLHEVSGSTEQIFAVTGIPDEKKGERLFVLYTLPTTR
jgi:acyl-[acyl-carrier-protein]-phospholipid O-acyltransferase/long-chain-fatty-acid--[acyl-carrier-protein] ligase